MSQIHFRWKELEMQSQPNSDSPILRVLFMLLPTINKGQPGALKLPHKQGPGRVPTIFGVLYAALPWFLHKRLFPGLEPVNLSVTWQQLYQLRQGYPSATYHQYFILFLFWWMMLFFFSVQKDWCCMVTKNPCHKCI